MTTDQQVRLLMSLIKKGLPLSTAAEIAGKPFTLNNNNPLTSCATQLRTGGLDHLHVNMHD